jgi:hypothetical protein
MMLDRRRTFFLAMMRGLHLQTRPYKDENINETDASDRYFSHGCAEDTFRRARVRVYDECWRAMNGDDG